MSCIDDGDEKIDKDDWDSEVSEVLSDVEGSTVVDEDGFVGIDYGSTAGLESPIRKVSCTEMERFAEEGLSDFDLFYHQITIFDVIFDLAAIFLTFVMNLTVKIIFESVEALKDSMQELITILIIQLLTNAATDVAVLFIISRRRFKRDLGTAFPLVWERYARKYFLPIFLPLFTGIAYYTFRYYMALRQSWHLFSLSDDSQAESACRHAWGPF
ncbi:hypothetical protein GEMRC1_006071 [Eukaryota sp. GEM-RC1]